jgi:Dolichyl-phosphate-mannose-protein mannosyltransferase
MRSRWVRTLTRRSATGWCWCPSISLACVLLAIVSIWAILRRRVEPGYAAVGILAFMATRGFDYAYDARSYAPLMGFAMASLAFWLASIDRRGWPRFAALAGMAAALALGLSSNYYGVLAFFPIAAGEAVRSMRGHRIQPGAWLAMAVAGLPLLAYLPLIHHNIAEFTPHAWNRPRAGMIFDSYIELVEGVFWPVLGLALYAAWKRKAARMSATEGLIQPYEAAAFVSLILYPIVGFLIAASGAGMISPRCAVPVCCGFGIAAALLCRRSFGSGSRAGVMVLSIALLWVVARESTCALVLAQQRRAFLSLRDAVAALPPAQPIVVGDSLVVLPFAYYSSEAVRARIVFPIDFDAIHAFESDDSGEQNLWAGRDGIFPVRIVGKLSDDIPPELIVIARPGGWVARHLSSFFVLTDVDTPLQTNAWQNLGGIFTPLAHEDTRLLDAHFHPVFQVLH